MFQPFRMTVWCYRQCADCGAPLEEADAVWVQDERDNAICKECHAKRTAPVPATGDTLL